MLTPEIIDAMKRMVKCGLPFAAVSLPGCKGYGLYVPVDKGLSQFVMREFNCGESGKSVVMSEVTASDFVNYDLEDSDPLENVSFEPTLKADYSSGVEEIIKALRVDGGKTVYSRVITSESNLNPVDVMLRYHEEHPSTMRYICNCAQFGLWFGATPELVIKGGEHGVETMALAGTRERGVDRAWDMKNSKEHDFVLEHIVNVFRNANLNVTVSGPESLQFGGIEHLMHRVTGEGDSDGIRILNELAPTPAICGVDKERALSHIKKYEAHSRVCYGGEIGIINEKRMMFYANLRCANVKYIGNGIWKYAIIVGGGLTADSDIEEEWRETELKAQSLLNIIENR